MNMFLRDSSRIRRDSLRTITVITGSTTIVKSVSRQLSHSSTPKSHRTVKLLRTTVVMTPVVLCITFCASNTRRETRLDDECASK